MGLTLLIARLLLAVVFVVAGLAKLADRSGSRQALRDFGVPALLATPLGILLPLAELAVAVALVPTASAWWGAIGALGLLLLFIAGIGFNLAKGRTPDCHCFGQLHSAPAGWPTLLRNLGLAAVAGFVVGLGRVSVGPSAISWLGALALAQRIELLVGGIMFALIAVEGWALVQVLQQQGRLLRRLEVMEAQFAAGGTTAGLTVGTLAPIFALTGLDSETITLDTLRAKGLPILLIFMDPDCGPCQALLPQIGRWQRDYADKLMLALISRGSAEANRAKSREHGVMHMLLQRDREVAEAYHAQGTPGAVLVRSDGLIGSPVVMGEDKIHSLVAGAVGLLGQSPLLMAVPATSNGHEATAHDR